MKRNNIIYLDNAATTMPNNVVVSLYEQIEKEHFANPNSIHKLGVDANTYLAKAREVILNAFKCRSHRVIFTASSTEANNLAIKGYCLNYQSRGKHIITSNIEHPSVLECFKQLQDSFGFKVTILEVNENGVINLDDLKQALNNETILVSIMAVNNEIGSINNIKEIAKIVHSFPKASLHVDTTQAIGKVDLPYEDIDMFVVSAHKLHGLKGSGCLVTKKTISFLPVISGGGQEDGFRSGTQSVAHACALAKAIQLAMAKKDNHVKELNSLLRSEVSKIDGVHINSNENASPYIFNFSLTKKKASVVVEALSNDNILVSSVSSCHSKREPSSYVVEAISHNKVLASNTIRVSLDETNTIEEIKEFINSLKHILETIK
jgi:cysteine desulfurase